MKLIECAFCGSKEAMVRSCSVESDRKSFNCECPQCFCIGPRAVTIWQASVLWNTRNGMVIEREAPGLSSGIAIQQRMNDLDKHVFEWKSLDDDVVPKVETNLIVTKKKRGRTRKVRK